MYNKIYRNSISAVVIIVMIMTAFAVPAMFNNEKAYASGSNNAVYDAIEKAMKDGGIEYKGDDSNTRNAMNVYVPNNGNKVSVSTTTPRTNTNFRVTTQSYNWNEEASFNEGYTFYIPTYFVISKSGQADIVYEMSATAMANQYRDIQTKYAGTNLLKVQFNEFIIDSNDEPVLTNNYDIKSVNLNAIGKILFNKNKGKFKTSSAAKWVANGKKYGTLPKMKTRKGYTFAGWYTAKTAGSRITSSSKVNLAKDTTMYAQWKYKVTLNANKGKVSGKKTKKKTVTSGKKYGSLKVPKRSGYNFAGWYTKKSGGKWTNKSSYASVSKHTLYAHWVKKSSYATKSQYKAIKKGMTYSEVKRIFGRSGKYAANYSGSGYKNYVWFGKSSNSAAIVLFVNGKVSDMDQVNL